jgi:aspartate/glutamate racemase
LKTIRIVGGTGPETTVDYYQRIIALYREKSGDNFPSIVINSARYRPDSRRKYRPGGSAVALNDRETYELLIFFHGDFS